jgi:uncharacterized protein (DUF1800 family)
MAFDRRSFMKLGGLAALGLSTAGVTPWLRQAQAAQPDPASIPPELHVLNRITWGPRPQDLQQIRQTGIEAYIDWQLQPENIPDPRIESFRAADPHQTMDAAALSAAAEADYGPVYFSTTWGRVYHAAYSERQLFERMVEFWTDHLNVPLPDLLVQKTLDDRTVIRQHALGRFRDLLLASAQSPAMLIYLDQHVSEREHPNENYARELLELHTLGVDGGYSEQDVVEVARILTGWTVDDSWTSFRYDHNMHDDGEKFALGRTWAGGRGIEEGLELFDFLAAHPSTARFVSYKLARRFVSDEPPQALVDSLTAAWLQSGGDLRAVMRTLLLSPAFMASAGQKFRRPLDYYVAILRVYDDALVWTNPEELWWVLEWLGQIPFNWGPPNGYPDATGAWLNTSMMLARWTAAMYLSLSWLDGASVNVHALAPDSLTAGELVDGLNKRILGRSIPAQDRAAFIRFLSDSDNQNFQLTAEQRDDRLPALVGLMLSSPHLMWY